MHRIIFRGYIMLLKMTAVHLLNFRNLHYMSRDLYRHAILLASPCKISMKSDNRLLNYGQKKTIFNMADVRHLELKNFHFCSCDCRRVRNLLMYTKFHQNRMIFTKIWRFNDF